MLQNIHELQEACETFLNNFISRVTTAVVVEWL